METIFAKRRARLLAMKAIRDNQTIPGEKTVTCPHCQQISDRKIVAQGLSVCPKCGYHFPIGAYYRLSTILDPGTFRELNEKYTAGDPLHFPDYREKLESAQRKTCLTEAAVTATGTIGGVSLILYGMISAIGVSYLLQNLATYITGGLPQMYPSLPGLSSQITIAGTSTKMVTVITPFLVVALVVVLTQLINHTKIGMAMRAASRDFETAQLMGIKINNIISFTFVIGSFLAAVGSALYFTNYPSIVPLSGSLPGLRAFVAAVFGGIGSIPGAVIGAFLIGSCENFVKIMPFDGATTFVDAFTFALLIIILVFKPTGLFGEKATDKV